MGTLTVEAQTERVENTHDMKTHPAIIYSFIKSQAGSLAKAVMELVQNSIDAGATKVDIKLDQFNITVEDNGAGFGTAEEIHAHFGTFGTPHEEGDSRFGRFRLGRGQIMAFAKTKWHTPNYIMDVDVQNRGLNYILTEGPDRTGVRIEGEFYKPVDGTEKWSQTYGYELNRVFREVTELIRYSDVVVLLNGEQVNTDPADMKWDMETEDAYFSFKTAGSFMLYNDGFFVRNYDAGTYGNALVVTKKHLKLNMARNQVLENECLVWKNIITVLKTQVVKRSTVGRMDDKTREFLARGLRYSERTLEEVKDMRIITLANGSNIAFKTLMGRKDIKTTPVAVGEKGDALAQKVHNEGLAYVIAKETFDRFDVATAKEFTNVIGEILSRDKRDSWRASAWYNAPTTTIYEAGAAFSGANSIVADRKHLTPVEKKALDTLENWESSVRSYISRATGRGISQRRLLAGESKTMLAWTDGRSYIAFSRSLLNSARFGTAGWAHILQTFVHEYLHEDDDGEQAYVHSDEFYQVFHNTIGYNWNEPKYSLMALPEKMNIDYLSKIRRAVRSGLPTKSDRLRRLEANIAEAEELEDVA